MQQDAEECWNSILVSLRDKLKVGVGCVGERGGVCGGGMQ